MKNNVYNYAVIRFRPYSETEEFVNIGIVLACSNTIDFKISDNKKRVASFFPELNLEAFKEAKKL